MYWNGESGTPIYEIFQKLPTTSSGGLNHCIHNSITNPNYYILCNGKQWYNHLSRQCNSHGKQPNSRKYPWSNQCSSWRHFVLHFKW